MSEWRNCKIRDIALNMADAPFGSNLKTEDYTDKGIIVIQGKNIQGRKCDWKDKRFVSYEKYQSLSRHHAQLGALVFPKVGTIGKVGILTSYENQKEYLLSTNTMMLQLNSEVASQDFVYYYFSSSEVRNHIQAINSNSVQPVFNFTSLKNYPISLPDIHEQKSIASILSSLDDKIELLNRQNVTLERMAETLFRQLMSEHDSLRLQDGQDDANNKSCPSNNPENRVQDNGEKEKEEWEEGTLDDILTVKGGTTPSTAEPAYWNGTIHWTSPRDITNLKGIYLFDTERKITELGLSKISSGLLPKGTLLMSSRAPVGVLAFSEVPVAINQGYIAILDNKGYSKEFIYLWLKSNIDLVHSFSNGSTFMEISKSAFKTMQLQIPPKQVLNDFQILVKPLFEKIKSNQTQILTLTALRDTLLPKLMNGEVRVSEHD